jgi:hypothetical protein
LFSRAGGVLRTCKAWLNPACRNAPSAQPNAGWPGGSAGGSCTLPPNILAIMPRLWLKPGAAGGRLCTTPEHINYMRWPLTTLPATPHLLRLPGRTYGASAWPPPTHRLARRLAAREFVVG